MKILFLDIDGVLNSQDFIIKSARKKGAMLHPNEMIDPESIEYLNKVIEETGAHIVISSTWRKSWKKNELEAHLEGYGLVYPIFDYTPIHESRVRGEEIEDYLFNLNEDVLNYVILDDDSDFLPHQFNNLIQTNFEKGLTNIKAEDTIQKLNE